MACNPGTQPIDHFLNWEYFDAIWCTFVLPSSTAFVAVAVFGPLMIAYYIHGDSMKIPIILGVILGSVIIADAPGGFVQLAMLALLALLAAGGYLVTQRLEN